MSACVCVRACVRACMCACSRILSLVVAMPFSLPALGPAPTGNQRATSSHDSGGVKKTPMRQVVDVIHRIQVRAQ